MQKCKFCGEWVKISCTSDNFRVCDNISTTGSKGDKSTITTKKTKT